MNVKANQVEDIDDAAGEAPGAFEIVVLASSKVAGMSFRCPCGCGRLGYLPFGESVGPSWDFDGNEDEPTLTPSVLQVGGCEWHGYLIKGQWSQV